MPRCRRYQVRSLRRLWRESKGEHSVATLSIRNLVDLSRPRAKCRECLFAHHLDCWNAPQRRRELQLTVDERVIEADCRGVLGGVGDINPRQAGPVDGTKAHGTWFARCVQVAILEFKNRKFLASLADSQYFRVSCRIVGGGHPVYSLGDNVAVPDNHSAKWPTEPGVSSVHRKLNRACHERIVHEFPIAANFPNQPVPGFVGKYMLGRASIQQFSRLELSIEAT